MNKRKILLSLTLCIFFILTDVTIASANSLEKVSTEDEKTIIETREKEVNSQTMTDKQKNAISMLNYMTVLSQEINASSNSKLYLDNVYSSIVNNINPNAVDSDSMSQIRALLNTINSYQSIATKRERIQYIYEQNQASAMRKAVPNPMSVLNVVQAGNPAKALVSVVFMAVDAKSSYDAYVSEVENKYMQDGWVLDDEAAENLHESRSDAFTYMVEMCQKNDIDGKLALNENAVKAFVTWKNNPNYTRRIEFLKDNEKKYSAYGQYWLVLAESYYDAGAFEECLKKIDTYENMHVITFRYDKNFAKTLVKGLGAVGEVYQGTEYVEKSEHYLNLILANIENDEDWALRYVAAESYMDLYARTQKRKYLLKAFDLAEENVNYLIDEQRKQNNKYLSELKKIEAKKNDTDTRKKEIKNFNKWLEEERKTELAPIYQPLVLNCELLFGIEKELNISDARKSKINNMLHGDSQPLFLISQYENKFWMGNKPTYGSATLTFDDGDITIPASYIMAGTIVKATITSGTNTTYFVDWKIDEVNRNNSTDIKDFIVKYESKTMKKYDYNNGDKIMIEIIPPLDTEFSKMTFKYNVSVTKKMKVLSDVKFISEN